MIFDGQGGGYEVRDFLGNVLTPRGYNDPAGSPGDNPIVMENALEGTPRSEWDLTAGSWGGIDTLQGFVDGFSVNRTETVRFKVGQSDSAGWSADIYRLGWYAGDGARLIDSLEPNSGQLSDSQSQPTPLDVDPITSKLSADCSNWNVTLEWDVPDDLPSGVFLAKLNRTGGGASHVIFVVRDDDRAADIMVMPSDSTWVAYNAFGGLGGNMLAGNSLYEGTTVNQYSGDCARFVSYNRPFVNRAAVAGGYGAVQWSTFFTGEYPMVRFLERNGYNVKYYSCLDAMGDPTGLLLDSVQVAMMIGHNEYWTDKMRSGWESAKAAGKSVFSCASNEVFWRTYGDPSSEDSEGRPRTQECYKSTIAGRSSTGRPQWTGSWRDPDGAGKGGDNPENTLTGTIFVVNGPDLRALRVPVEYNDSPLWRNTSVAGASSEWVSPGQILGFEWDTYGPDGVSTTAANFLADPHPQAHYASSSSYTINSGLLLTDAGDVYDSSGTATHRLVVMPSGANGGITFGTGTINWSFGLDESNTFHGVGLDNTSTPIRQATVNILADMGALPESLMSGLVAPTPHVWDF